MTTRLWLGTLTGGIIKRATEERLSSVE